MDNPEPKLCVSSFLEDSTSVVPVMDRVDEIFLSDTRDVNAHVARSCPSYPAE